MQQMRNYGDQRQLERCAYCGAGAVETRDHVPSRVLLDEPYPENLPVVPACRSCNESFSGDEEYLACVLEVVVAGEASPEAVARPKIARLLRMKPALKARLDFSRRTRMLDVRGTPSRQSACTMSFGSWPGVMPSSS